MAVGIIFNESYESDSKTHQIERLKKELSDYSEEVVLIGNSLPFSNDSFIKNISRAIFLDKDIDFALSLEKQGIKLFNSAEAVETADSKAKTFLCLAGGKNYSLPKTFIAPLIHFGVQSEKFNEELLKHLSFPLVVKESRGSWGRQVYLVKSREELSSLQKDIGTREHIYQEFVSEFSGSSIRVYAVGNKILGAVKFSNNSDFRSNAAAGGKGERIAVSKKIELASLEIMDKMKLSFCGIDFFVTEEPMVIEVNSNACFKVFEESSINVAGEIAKFVIKEE